MIKRLTFVSRRADLSFDEFDAAWTDAPRPAAPDGAVRMAVGSAIPDLSDPDRRHDGVLVEWFPDLERLVRYEVWLRSEAGRRATAPLVALVDRSRTTTVVADEVVRRGEPWLERRWDEGGERLKHMALGIRARQLDREEFSARWRAEGGAAPTDGESPALALPEDVRGAAYVQNHPLNGIDRAYAYDAINEVYVDDRDDLVRRVEWFAAHVGRRPPLDFVAQAWFLSVREVVVVPAPGHTSSISS